jgi:SAM-dependent methyltransferase
MSEVLEHLDEEVFQAALTEVRRVLRPGSRFIGTVPAREKLEDSLVICSHCGSRFHRWGYKRSFTAETFTAALRQYFLVDSAYEHFFIEWKSVGWWRKLQGAIKKFLSWLSIGTYGLYRNIYFCARKPS